MEEVNIHLSPEQLKSSKTFQESWRTSKPYIQDLMLYLQRKKCSELKGDHEELGRQIIIINDIMNLFEECSANEVQARQNPKRRQLHNK